MLPIALGTGVSLLGDASLYVILPINMESAGVTLAQVGILLSANRVVRLLFNNLGGVAYDRLPRRPLFVSALVLGAISSAIYAFAKGYYPLLLGRLIWGVAWVGIWIGGNTIILDNCTEQDRGRWIGIYQMAFFLGASSGAIFGGTLNDLIGFQYTMGLAAALTFVSALFALLLLPGNNRGSQRESLAGTAVTTQKPRLAIRDRLPPLALLGAYRLVVAGILLSTFSLYLQQQFGQTFDIGSLSIGLSTMAGAGLGIGSMVSLAASPLAGHLSDRADSRWRVVSVALLPGIVGYILLALAAPFAVILGLPLIFASSGSNQSLATTLVGDLTDPKMRSRSLGWLYTVGDLASAIGPLLAFGVLIPLAGTTGLYIFCMLVLLILCLYSLSLQRIKSR